MKMTEKVQIMKETVSQQCVECRKHFETGEIVNYTWYGNSCFCDKCKELMNKNVKESYFKWQQRIAYSLNDKIVFTIIGD